MSIPAVPLDVKLVISVLYGDNGLFQQAVEDLLNHFGRMDYVSGEIGFTETSYYGEELGNEIYRKFISFGKLFSRSKLSDVKLITNNIENKYSDKSKKRHVNIDPGFLSLENFILATGKNYSHRIYLSDGIYADLTLMYRHKSFHGLPWTYPDYDSEKIKAIFLTLRKIYKFQITGKLLI